METSATPRHWLYLALRFLLTCILLFPLVAFSSCFVAIAIVNRDAKQPGFGARKETFPLVVIVPRSTGSGHEARLVEFRELHAALADSRATLLVPRSEEADIREQIRRMSAGDSDGSHGRYFRSSLEVEHLADGRQRIHVVASKYDDSPNESWYVASARGFEPEFHSESFSLGHGARTALMTGIISLVLTPIIALLIVWRWARKNRLRLAQQTAS